MGERERKRLGRSWNKETKSDRPYPIIVYLYVTGGINSCNTWDLPELGYWLRTWKLKFPFFVKWWD
jgi:hypothetical protein